MSDCVALAIIPDRWEFDDDVLVCAAIIVYMKLWGMGPWCNENPWLSDSVIEERLEHEDSNNRLHD
jgi:hypothetical protein